MSAIDAIVAYPPQDNKVQWKHQKIDGPRQPGEHEVLVRMASVGICHTDLFVTGLPAGAMGLTYPKVVGHEGAGYIEAVGSGVTVGQKGDPVLLSYSYCGSCDLCGTRDITYCENFGPLNFLGEDSMFKMDGQGVAGKFFGQSSFAAMSIVNEQSIVNVKDQVKSADELKMLAPLGCGLMTGAGAVINKCEPHDVLVVTGLGAVGMGAISAAKQLGCKAIVAVDRVESRLEIAKEFGATHLYNTAGKELSSFVKDVQGLVGGQRITRGIDTTAVPPVIEQLILSLGKRGKMIQVGAPALDANITLPMGDFFYQTKIFEINYLGDAKASELLPKMIQWYKEGNFAIDKIIKFYPLDKVHEALEDMKGKVIKPILVFE